MFKLKGNNMKKVLLSVFLGLLIVPNAHAVPSCGQSLMPAFTANQATQLCKTFGSAVSQSLIPSADNTYDVGSSSLGWRTGYFDTSVITPLVVSPGTADLIVKIDDDAQRLQTIGASSDTALTYKFGDGGITAVQQLTISASTADADDDSSLILAGGGAAGGTRGASITLPGEEVSGGSNITYNAGTGDTHIFQVAGTTEVTLSDDAIAYAGASTTLTLGSTAGGIYLNTPDAADTARLFVAAGNAYSGSGTRGAFMLLNGNEQGSTPGDLVLGSGTGGSKVIEFRPGGVANTWLMADSGTLIGAGTATIGWVVKAGANTACTTTCTTPCVLGFDTAVSAVPVLCSDATADTCLCAGAS